MATKQTNSLKPATVVGVVLVVVLAMSALAAVVNTVSDPPEDFTRPDFSEVAGKGPSGAGDGPTAAGKSAVTAGVTELRQAPVKTGTVDFGNGLVAQTPSGWTHSFDEDTGLEAFSENDSTASVFITFYTGDAGSFTSADVVDAYVDDFVLGLTDVELVGEGPNGQRPFEAPLPNDLLADPVAVGYTAFLTSQSSGSVPLSGLVFGAVVDDELGIAIEVVDESSAFDADDFADQDELIASIRAA